MLKNGLGAFIGFSGIDGAGKSTQAAILVTWLRQQGCAALLREGKRNFVSTITNDLAARVGLPSGREYLGHTTFLLCQSFDVLQETMFDVVPYTQQGTTVVTARTAFCRLAAGIRRGVTDIEQVSEIMFHAGKPDLTIWLDVSPEVAYARIEQRGEVPPAVKQLADYRQALASLFERYGVCRIPADDDIESVTVAVQSAVQAQGLGC